MPQNLFQTPQQLSRQRLPTTAQEAEERAAKAPQVELYQPGLTINSST